MKIRKATTKDFKEYLKLKRMEEKDLSNRAGKRITYPKSNILKKEFETALSSKKHLILVIEHNNKLIAYMHATYFSNPYNKGGYIEDIFVLKQFRKKGLAKKLIKDFEGILKEKKYKILQLSVNVKNKLAISLYKKQGFEVYHYDMKKRLR